MLVPRVRFPELANVALPPVSVVDPIDQPPMLPLVEVIAPDMVADVATNDPPIVTRNGAAAGSTPPAMKAIELPVVPENMAAQLDTLSLMSTAALSTPPIFTVE